MRRNRLRNVLAGPRPPPLMVPPPRPPILGTLGFAPPPCVVSPTMCRRYSGHAILCSQGKWVGLSTFFANIFENIDGPAHFRILEYSREYRCPGRLFLKNIDLFFRPLTVVDLDSQDILEYSRRYNRSVYNLLTRASRNSSFAPRQ